VDAIIQDFDRIPAWIPAWRGGISCRCEEARKGREKRVFPVPNNGSGHK